jgi:hypothetical protein
VRNYRRTYPSDLRDALRRSMSYLMDSGVSRSTIYRLKTGRTKNPSFSTLSAIIAVNQDYWLEKMEKGGVRRDHAIDIMKYSTPNQITFELKERRKIAEIISRRRDDGKNHPIKDVLEGMARSDKLDAVDWCRYVKELYNEQPNIKLPPGSLKGIRPMTERKRRKYFSERRKRYG